MLRWLLTRGALASSSHLPVDTSCIGISLQQYCRLDGVLVDFAYVAEIVDEIDCVARSHQDHLDCVPDDAGADRVRLLFGIVGAVWWSCSLGLRSSQIHC